MCIKKIGLELYLWLDFNFMTRKPIQMVQITYFDSMKIFQPKIIRFVNFSLKWSKKFMMQVMFIFWRFSLILLISTWCKPSFEIKFDQFGQVTMLFWCGGGSHPPCTWQGFQTSHLLGLNEKNSTAKIEIFFWQNFLRKLVFMNFYFFTFL